jgi:hypothetical protein
MRGSIPWPELRTIPVQKILTFNLVDIIGKVKYLDVNTEMGTKKVENAPSFIGA